MICETCLGNNPFMRMTKLPFGQKLCKVSNLPYQGFRWKAGTHGRFKETIVSYAVAREKNLCQACLNDMQFGLPVGVRDSMLRQQGSGQNELAPVHSAVGTQYHYEQLQRRGEDEDAAGASDLALAVAEYQQQAQTAPQRQMLHDFAHGVAQRNVARQPAAPSSSSSRAAPEAVPFRNLPKLCTFWLAGTCRRVATKSCPFRPCCGIFQFPELAGGDSAAREANQRLVAQLQADGPDKVQRSLDKGVRQVLHDALRRRKTGATDGNVRGANVDESIRARVLGSDALTQKYLGQLQAQADRQRGQDDARQQEIARGLSDPLYQAVRSLWVGNLPRVLSGRPDEAVDPQTARDVLRQTLWTALQRFGVPIASVHVGQNLAHAFVDYGDHAMAQHALQLMSVDPPLVPSPVLLVAEAASAAPPAVAVTWQPLTVIRWATPPALKQASPQSAAAAAETMPAPPGLEHAPRSAYSLPNAPAPRLPIAASSHGRPSAQGEAPAPKRRRTAEASDGNALSGLLAGYGSSDDDA